MNSKIDGAKQYARDRINDKAKSLDLLDSYMDIINDKLPSNEEFGEFVYRLFHKLNSSGAIQSNAVEDIKLIEETNNEIGILLDKHFPDE